MVQSIKEIIKNYGIAGDILLYRDENHRKKKLCEYIAQNIDVQDKTIYTYSDGAFALYLARAFPNNTVKAYFRQLSWDYGEIMQVTANLELHDGITFAEFEAMSFDGIKINQFKDSLIKDYYKTYFEKIADALKGFNVTAFCDCGHSCATLAGFVEKNLEDKLVDWQFVLGVNGQSARPNLWQLEPYRERVMQFTTANFDTYEIGDKIEEKYPDFGNVFEATRSISAAMAYLQEHPNETVAVYVGDSFVKEGSRFRSSTRKI